MAKILDPGLEMSRVVTGMMDIIPLGMNFDIRLLDSGGN